MRGDVTYRRRGWFRVEASVELTPHAWATASGWRRGAARRALPKISTKYPPLAALAGDGEDGPSGSSAEASGP